MKRFTSTLSLLVALFFLASTVDSMAQDSTQTRSQVKNGNQSKWQKANQNKAKGFIDANGDGYNDNAMDADGDGVPNGRDADYTGAKMRKGNSNGGFVDADGDGINDNALDSDGDGIPNGQDPDFVRPQDGSGRQMKKGFGPGKGQGQGQRSGDCTGTGSAGKGKRGKN